MYPITNLCDDGDVHRVENGTNILISGPPHTGADELYLSLMAEGVTEGEGVIFITTDKSAKKVLSALSSVTGDESLSNVVIIDARSGYSSPMEHDATVYNVGSPTDLTGIGIRITTAMQYLHQRGFRQIRLGLNSISTLAQFHTANTVFKFLHVLCGRVDATAALGIGFLNRAPTDEDSIDLVSAAYDVHAEFRERDDVTESRVIGLEPELRAWSEA
ncbi:hypothetical protein [Haladaptatus sp. DJG-WS-42]|uniref:DUF7504 family protein n=1 Tax=Haladaptatus sp. DJG-WS-42 TaxID=3120516 RepID=UPI0030D0FDF1